MKNISELTILVTGGAGFIGSHLTEALLHLGASVVVLDNFDPFYDPQEKRANLGNCTGQKQFMLVEGDIREHETVRKVLAQFHPEVIVHLAARAGVRPSIEQPELYTDINVRGTTVLLEAARQAQIKRFIFASSSSVYGNPSELSSFILHPSSFILHPFRESDSTDHPLSPYGATKKAGETLGYTYHHLYRMSLACLRFFTVYGPRQRPDLAIRKFVKLALQGQEIPIFGDGSSRRDYTHIRDILSGIIGAITWTDSDSPRYGIFNLGSSHPVVLNDLVDLIEKYIEKPVQRKYLPPQSGDVFHTFADTTLAEQELGFQRSVMFEDGLQEFVEWMKAISN